MRAIRCPLCFPSNASCSPITVDIPKHGKAVVQALRTDLAQWWTSIIKEFKQTIGAAEVAKGDYDKCESDLDTLANMTSIVGFQLNEESVGKVESCLGFFAERATDWTQMLMKGSVDGMVKTVKKITDDVLYDLDTADAPLRLRVLNALASCSSVLGCDTTAQRITDVLLGLESQHTSGRIVASVQALQMGNDVGPNCDEIVIAWTAKPMMNEQAGQALTNVQGMCEGVIKAAASMKSWTEVKPVCVFFRVAGSRPEFAPEHAVFAKVFVSTLKFKDAVDTMQQCVNGDARKVLPDVSSAIQAVRNALGDATLCNPVHQSLREDMKNGFLNQMVSEAAAKLRQEVQKMLQGLCDTAVVKISRLQQVCKMGPSGKHWADDYDPSSGKTILQYAESTLLQVLQPPLKKLADEVQQAAD